MLAQAIIFATNAHNGQFRKATNTPYIVHPLEALVIASQISKDEEILCAAVLHDTIEDCEGITKEVIASQFSEHVAELVSRESENKELSWKERKQTTINNLEHSTFEEQVLVLADKLSNIRSIERDYKVLGETLWQRFNEKHKETIGWYYRSIGEKLTQLVQFDEYKEYSELVKKVFG